MLICNMNVNPGFGNVQCEMSDYKSPGTIVYGDNITINKMIYFPVYSMKFVSLLNEQRRASGQQFRTGVCFTFKSLLIEDNRVIFRSLCETEKFASVREREKAQERGGINRGGEKETKPNRHIRHCIMDKNNGRLL